MGSATPSTQLLTGSSIGSSCTFKNAVPTTTAAGSGTLSITAEVIFDPIGTVTVGGQTFDVQGNDVKATAISTCTPSGDPENAIENPGKPVSINYKPSTGALTWSINPTYKDNVKPGSTTKIDQFANEHFILTLKRGSTVVEKEIHFDTVSTASNDIKTTRSGNNFSATYKTATALTPGSYTIELLNERSMGSGDNLTGTYSFTVTDDTKPTTVKGALEKLLDNGFTSSSTAKDIRATILDTVSGSTTAAKLKKLSESLQDDSSTARSLVELVQDVEKKFLTAKKITVSRKSDSKLGTSIASVTGLGLNTASGSQITIEAASASRSYDTPSGARASALFSLTVSGLSNNKSMDFPVQVAMKLPDSFNSTNAVYVLHYTSSTSSEKLDAYIRNGNVIFTTTSFSDFALVQENPNGYAVTISSTSNGAVTSDKKEAAKGNTVTLTIQPATGYTLAALAVTDKNGRSVTATKQNDSQYAFIMPDADVTVQAAFIASSTDTFSDVPSTNTFYKEISWAARKGIMNGTGGGLFSPKGRVTRQQLWMVLGRMAGANPADMAAARTWAINNGISDGTGATNSVSRQQLVTMLYRYAVKRNLNVSGSVDIGAYPDNGSVSSYAKDAMAWAVGNGIVSGTSDGRLNPTGTANRGQFAAFLYRFNQKTGA